MSGDRSCRSVGRIMKKLETAGRQTPSPVSDAAVPLRADGNALLTAVLWGDAHASLLLSSRSQTCLDAARDVAAAESVFDALLLVGDVTENGETGEYRFMADCWDLMRGRVKHYIPATGNHDVRLRPIGVIAKRFGNFCDRVGAPAVPGKTYYSLQVNGYPFIVLGTTRGTFEEAAIDGEELRWFENELKKSAADGKPVFVLLHQALKNTNGLPDIWSGPSVSKGDVGPQNDALRELMDQSNNIFLLTGHTHMGFGAHSFDRAGKIFCVNVPSVGVPSKFGEYNAPGTGYIMEVFGDRVRFRARDHIRRVDLPELDVNVLLE